MPRIGMTEVIIFMAIIFTWLIPIAAGAWALFTLQRLRSGLEAIRIRLEAIERLIQRAPTA